MAGELRVGVLNADPDQLDGLRERLSSLECASASFDADAGAIECSTRGQPDVLLVCGTDDPEKAVELCRQVREAEGEEGLPLLLAITAYQMFAAHDLKRIPNSHYVVAPVDEEAVRERVERLRRGQDW
jgi:CheY-like chemotaxis protein